MYSISLAIVGSWIYTLIKHSRITYFLQTRTHSGSDREAEGQGAARLPRVGKARAGGDTSRFLQLEEVQNEIWNDIFLCVCMRGLHLSPHMLSFKVGHGFNEIICLFYSLNIYLDLCAAQNVAPTWFWRKADISFWSLTSIGVAALILFYCCHAVNLNSVMLS